MFVEADTWTGGDIELLVFYRGSVGAAPRDLLAALWSWNRVAGPYLSNQIELDQQDAVRLDRLRQDNLTPLYGVAVLPNGMKSPFSTTLIVDEDGTWLYAGTPLGALGRCYPVRAFPFDASPQEPWAREVYEWLADLARWLFVRHPFTLGAIGWLTTLEVEELAEDSIPATRYHCYLRPSAGGLDYLPPNADGPLMTAG